MNNFLNCFKQHLSINKFITDQYLFLPFLQIVNYRGGVKLKLPCLNLRNIRSIRHNAVKLGIYTLYRPWGNEISNKKLVQILTARRNNGAAKII